VMSFHVANFRLPRNFRSRVTWRHATDRQTDGHSASFHNVPSLGHNNASKMEHDREKYRDTISVIVTFNDTE